METNSCIWRVVIAHSRTFAISSLPHQELENFHGVLSDISYGRSTDRVKEFMVQAYVKGARCGNAHHAELEGSTAVFSRRRYRDKWNRTIVRRLARTRTHTVRVKARVRARGVTGQQYFNERMVTDKSSAQGFSPSY